MQKAPPTPKGFRDILPEAAKVRHQTINKITDVLEGEGFSPIETPTIEFAETLTGKYGEEEKLIYKFTDRGERELALRYDLTVPLARFVASNQQLIAKGPFRRYQIGQVFRGENPQHGRYREFTQFDFDTVGAADLEEDAKIIVTAIKSAKNVGLKNPVMTINDRTTFSGFPIEVIRAIDKFAKVGKEGVEKELDEKGFSKNQIEEFFTKISNSKPTDLINQITRTMNDLGLKESVGFIFDPMLARGIDYYTGTIFELKADGGNLNSLTIGAGGRYDNLIGTFAGRQIPAVGFSFGIDRLIESLG